ncbi:MAG: hypothetical protein SGJ20_02490 [Planctomycetota bacterium]|nr:hypothetical protein [Planctomycetota bacterium]
MGATARPANLATAQEYDNPQRISIVAAIVYHPASRLHASEKMAIWRILRR